LETSSSRRTSSGGGRRLRIAIVTPGRFHVVDLARELLALGHDVTLYSPLPPWQTRRMGVPISHSRWLGPIAAGAVLAARRAMRSSRLREAAARAVGEAVDLSAAAALGPCDVVIGMSGLSLRTLQRARRRFGAVAIVERSSQHILAQREILAALDPSGRRPELVVPRWTVERELAEYEVADRISVPARHVVRSFVARGVPEARLLRNPFGTDIARFRPTPPPPAGTRRIVMAGSWSLQKGADVLVEAWRRLDRERPVELVHCGAVVDVPVPREARFLAAGFLSQAELWRRYGEANVFALASRQEGMAVVQLQALASGLPLVCTTRTGGEDLRDYLADPEAVSVVPPEDPEALAAALDAALERPPRLVDGARDALGEGRHALSWRGYAERWDDNLKELCG
jgi:glycosyltransferase involved in cell wall biosynthesis